MERVRVRVAFEGHRILSETQKKEGLKRSWILFKPKNFKTISDLSAYLLNIFHLHHSCPDGLVLSMDGFVLPPCESTCIFKDNDIVCVRKKREASSELIRLDDGANGLNEVQIVKQPVQTGLKLLANEEFDKEKGGYERESEEDEHKKGLEDTPNVNKVSKKRKASKKLQGSKRKKSKLSTAEESPVVEDVQNGELKSGSSRDHSLLKKKKSSLVQGDQDKWRTRIPEIGQTSNCINKCMPDAKRFSQLEENGKGNVDLSSTPVGTKKFPSRSARRKKAKRQWLREQAKIEKMELHQKQLRSKDNLQSPDKDGQNLSNEHQQIDSHGKDNKRLSDGYQQSDPNGDEDDDTVPVVIRPGHIRFQPLSKVDDVQAVQQNQNPVETFQWNGITSKKKGQKWGTEKAAFSKRSLCLNFNQFSEMPTIEEEIPIGKDVEFDKLPPYTSLPKEGDVIAYRLIELTSSWTPEPSSFRVGKISWYDSESNKIILAPVPEYPIAFEKKTDEDASALQSDTLYGEDGSLQLEFSLLLDVRIVKHGGEIDEVRVGDQDAVINLRDNNKHKKAHAPPQGNGEFRVGDQDAATNGRDNINKEETPAQTQENGKGKAWDEINQVLSAKKAALSQVDDQSTKESSSRRLSYKALRSSALGPTMAFLRSQNGL